MVHAYTHSSSGQILELYVAGKIISIFLFVTFKSDHILCCLATTVLMEGKIKRQRNQQSHSNIS